MRRWFAVLDAFARSREWGVRELAADISISPAAAHRILHEMERAGLLAAGASRGQFRVGPELWRLSVLLAERMDVKRIARPTLKWASDVTGETVILALYSPARRKFWAADAVESAHPIRYSWELLRDWSDLHRGASGKGILAFLPEDERESILAELDRTSRSKLRHELDRIRVDGFAISHGERSVGAVGVAAPIRDAADRVIGDVVATWPDNRTDRRKEASAAEIVIKAAERISSELGSAGGRSFRQPEPPSARTSSRPREGEAGMGQRPRIQRRVSRDSLSIPGRATAFEEVVDPL
jgi:DNA-binding IclR family transcriptional regulator